MCGGAWVPGLRGASTQNAASPGIASKTAQSGCEIQAAFQPVCVWGGRGGAGGGDTL